MTYFKSYFLFQKYESLLQKDKTDNTMKNSVKKTKDMEVQQEIMEVQGEAVNKVLSFWGKKICELL